MNVSQHIQALGIALASSTDNFLVGLSVGLTQKPLKRVVLWGIALCNATGCWIATSGGSWSARHLDPKAANGLACLAFSYLALKEYTDNNHNNNHAAQQQQAGNKPKHVSLQLALPMTLNNLAGGVTAGVLGVSAAHNFLYALLVSVLTMWVGYRLGKAFAGNLQTAASNRWIMYGPILIYLTLALQSLVDILS